jgi:hypothetical protein
MNPSSSSSSIALFALLLSSCAAQQPSCSVCGDGMEVGNPDALVVFPGQSGQIPCGVLENMGVIGLIPVPQCEALPQLISTICECQPIDVTTTTATPPQTMEIEATQPGGKSTKSYSMSVSSKAGKSATSKSSKSTQSSMMIATAEFGKAAIAPASDTTTLSTSSGFNNSDLTALLSWIAYDEGNGERAKLVDSLFS